jgi:DNA-binding transcriptional LysR family regulator
MKLTQLDGLVAFVTVARLGSFTAAAAALEVTPPAVSQAMKQLEARLGVRLVHRTTRSVGLSAAGERYLARVAPAVSELLEAAQELDAYRAGLAGTLRLNAPHVVHQMLLRRAVAAFLDAHPAVRIEMALDDGFVDIAAAGFDAGVRLGESVQRDMIAVPLTARERMALVASPAYARRRGLPATIEALREHACIRFRFKSSGAIYRWELLRNRRRIEVEVDGPITISDSLGPASAALDGLGIAYVFERQVAAELAAGQLLPVLPGSWITQAGLHFYYSSRRQVSPVLKAFMAHCVEAARRTHAGPGS